MDFAFSPEQEELARSARGFLSEFSSPEAVRRAMAEPRGWDPELWRRIGAEMGWPAVIVPEAYGGLGLGYVELAALMEEMGAALLCSPFFSTVCLAANLLLLGGSEEQKQRYLPALAAGELTATVALTEAPGRWDAEGVQALVSPSGDGFKLEGTKTYVTDGHTADLLLVAARAPGTSGEQGVSWLCVPADAPGLKRRALVTMDQTRRQAELSFEGLGLAAGDLVGEQGGGWELAARVLDLAAVALSAEQVGGARRCLEMAVEYAKERRQFGRPIGGFQAVKHKCADMMVEVESARSASYYAAWTASAWGGELPTLASLAKSYCSEAYFNCAAEALQIHGGVGFTWEYDVHLYFKRAQSSETLLGDAAYHRELLARRVGI
jgi:alkylation response protein AidB-like acyl-CoA dehydrogenase